VLARANVVIWKRSRNRLTAERVRASELAPRLTGRSARVANLFHRRLLTTKTKQVAAERKCTRSRGKRIFSLSARLVKCATRRARQMEQEPAAPCYDAALFSRFSCPENLGIELCVRSVLAAPPIARRIAVPSTRCVGRRSRFSR
jgi:hypothetical protein